jgi:hypothetical protein
LFAVAAVLVAQVGAQVRHASSRPFAANVVVPQARAFAPAGRPGRIEITGVSVGVVILEQAATTTMDISLKNLTNRRQEAELIIPVPDGAVIRGFTFQGSAKEPKAELLPKDKATSIYNAIVAKVRDPAA